MSPFFPQGAQRTNSLPSRVWGCCRTLRGGPGSTFWPLLCGTSAGRRGVCRQARLQGKVPVWAFGAVSEVETKCLRSRVRAKILAPVPVSPDLPVALQQKMSHPNPVLGETKGQQQREQPDQGTGCCAGGLLPAFASPPLSVKQTHAISSWGQPEHPTGLQPASSK